MRPASQNGLAATGESNSLMVMVSDMDKLAAVGLIPERDVMTLTAYLQSYVDSRGGCRPGHKSELGAHKQNLRTTFETIIATAGEKPRPTLFHNLWASRQTELGEVFPSHVVCRWQGNSQALADCHDR